MNDAGILELPDTIKPSAIQTDDPFFSSAPFDIGITSNELIDKLLYGIECKK